MRFATIMTALGLGALYCGCASTPGAQPHDMSAASHEAMAANEDKNAAAHQKQFDAKQTKTDVHRCTSGARAEGGFGDTACWTEYANDTAEHREEAEKHRKMAADHRAASQALRDAEARACVGISADDRDISPFHHREDIVRVEAFTPATSGGRSTPHTVGAVVTLRAVPGLTAQWLQRIVDCHVARNASLGHVVPEMPYCPLVPKGVSAQVLAIPDGFSIAIRSDDPESATEILTRAQALKPR